MAQADRLRSQCPVPGPTRLRSARGRRERVPLDVRWLARRWPAGDVKLAGEVALLTGGGGAMGGAQARLFAAEGCRVCAAHLFADKTRAVTSEFGSGALGAGLP